MTDSRALLPKINRQLPRPHLRILRSPRDPLEHSRRILRCQEGPNLPRNREKLAQVVRGFVQDEPEADRPPDGKEGKHRRALQPTERHVHRNIGEEGQRLGDEVERQETGVHGHQVQAG